MKSNKHHKLIALLLITASLSCNKQKHFPDDSTEGKNVFGCYISGKKFLPCADFLKARLKTQVNMVSLPYISLSVAANNTCDNRYEYGRSIIISIDSIQLTENKTYTFGNYLSRQNGQLTCTYSEYPENFVSDSSLSGTLTVRKYDPDRRIVAVNFNVILKNPANNETVQLTNGMFDVTY